MTATTQALSVEEIAKGLVEKCRAGENLAAIEEYYADDVLSVEAFASEGFAQQVQGKQACIEKNKSWFNCFEVHSHAVEGPQVGGNAFAVTFRYDVTNRQTNERSVMEELAVYTTAHGKIVKEEFYYPGA